MKTVLAISVALVIAMSWVAICLCEDQINAMDGLTTFDGSVVSVDAGKSVLVVQGGTTATFTVSANTRITKDIYPISLSDIEAGDYVSVGYSTGRDGSSNAITVSVRYGKANIY